MRRAAGAILFFLVLVGLACSLPTVIESPATQQPMPVGVTSPSSGAETSPTRDPASGLKPVGVSTLSSDDETLATPTVTQTPLPTVEPTLEVQSSPSPTALPEINLDPVTTQTDPELGRPRLSGQMQALDTRHFRIHYTLKS